MKRKFFKKGISYMLLTGMVSSSVVIPAYANEVYIPEYINDSMIIDNNDVNTVVQPENTIPSQSVPVDTDNGEIISQIPNYKRPEIDIDPMVDTIELPDINTIADENISDGTTEEIKQVASVKVGDEVKTFETLADVATEVNSLTVPEANITILEDIELSKYVSIKNLNGTKITIDLNGHKIIGLSGAAANFTMYGNIEIFSSVEGGEISNESGYVIQMAGAKSGDNIIHTNVTIGNNVSMTTGYRQTLAVFSYATLTINDGANLYCSNDANSCIGLRAGGTLVVNGGSIGGKCYAIAGNGLQDGTQITINGGKISGDYLVMYHPQEGNLTITGGEFTGLDGIQYCGSGEIKISGGTFRATREYTEFPDKSSQEADGNTDDGSALSLISRGSGYQDKDAEGKVKTMKLEITGGEFISDNNNAISIYRLKQHPDTKIWYVDNDTNDISNTNDTDFLDNYTEYVNISGGTFKSGSVDKKETLHVDPKAKEMGTVTITGGKFTTDPSQANNPANPDEPFNYVADGYIVEDTEDGMKLVTLPKPPEPEPEPPSNGGDDGTGDDNTGGDNGTGDDNTDGDNGTGDDNTGGDNGTGDDNTDGDDGTGDDNTDGDDDKPNGDNNNNHRPSGGGSSSSDDDDEKTPSTVVDKTELEDGSKVTVESGKDSVTTTVERPDGSSSVTTVDSDGSIKSDVMIVNEAIDRNKNADAPISHITASDDTDSAHSITITVEDNNFAKVEIPVENMTAGTVAVKVHPDGREEVIKMTAMGENGVIVPVDGIATVKIVDRSKYFIDVPDTYWGTHAVDYVASRDLFAGTSDITFTPDGAMTRAMVWTVLARFDGHDTTGGETWYEKGCEWAMANGVSDGTNHDVEITREQLVSMLHRYYMYKGHANDTINYSIEGYADYGNISEYAVNSMEWAVNTGLITGTSDVTLSPVDNATRGQVAMIMMNFCEKLARQQ